MLDRWMPWTVCLAALLVAAPAAAEPKGPLQEARARQAKAEFDEAAEGFERFVRESPAASEAPQALEDALGLRLGLGQADQARADAVLFVRLYGAKAPARAAHVGLATALDAVEHEDWARAASDLQSWVDGLDGRASLGDRLVAHAALGRTLVKRNEGGKADREYALVRDAWKDPATAARAILPDGERALGKALTAVGEALFFFAEKKRREADAIRFPELRGPATKEAVLAHLRTSVKDWVLKRRPAIEQAERAYLEVVELQPAPPPRYVIASASRVGTMWATFVAEFRAAPIPSAWKGHGAVPGAGAGVTYDQLRALYYRSLDESSAPQKQTAKHAFSTCVTYSVKYQYSDAFALKCHEWLEKNYAREFHGVDELMPRPAAPGPGSLLGAPVAGPG